MEEELNVKFGLTQDSSQRFRGVMGRFAHMDELMHEQMALAIDRLSAEAENAIRQEFIAGTDSQGVSHNKTGQTLETLKAEVDGLQAIISMGRGGPYVEFGSVPHDIPNAFGWGITVHHPGYVGDDFMGRAIHEDIDLHYSLSQMALGFEHDLFREGEYGTSVGPVADRVG